MIVWFARPPFMWPPDVTRSQSVRDLLLLVDAFTLGAPDPEGA